MDTGAREQGPEWGQRRLATRRLYQPPPGKIEAINTDGRCETNTRYGFLGYWNEGNHITSPFLMGIQTPVIVTESNEPDRVPLNIIPEGVRNVQGFPNLHCVKGAAVFVQEPSSFAEPTVGKTFRHPYSQPAGSPGVQRFTTNDIQWGLLPNLTASTKTPTFATLESWTDGLWLDHLHSWTNYIFCQPSDNQGGYNQQYIDCISQCIMKLCENHAQATKQPLMYNLLQHAIDVYGLYVQGKSWRPGKNNFCRRRSLPGTLSALDVRWPHAEPRGHEGCRASRLRGQ